MVGRIYLNSRGEYVNSLDNLLPNHSLKLTGDAARKSSRVV
jgi:hypothetical protein